MGTYSITCTKGTLTSTKYDFTNFATGTLTIIYKWSGFTQPKQKAGSIVLNITQLKYDGVATTTNASLKYKWNTNINGTYKMFTARIATSTSIVESHFRSKKNQTILMTKLTDVGERDQDEDLDTRPVKITLTGMIVIGLQTNKENIDVSY